MRVTTKRSKIFHWSIVTRLNRSSILWSISRVFRINFSEFTKGESLWIENSIRYGTFKKKFQAKRTK